MKDIKKFEKFYWYSSKLILTKVQGFLVFDKVKQDFKKEGINEYQIKRPMKIDCVMSNIINLRVPVLTQALEQSIIDNFTLTIHKSNEKRIETALKAYKKDPKSINMKEIFYERIFNISGISYEDRGYATKEFFENSDSLKYLQIENGEEEYLKEYIKKNK